MPGLIQDVETRKKFTYEIRNFQIDSEDSYKSDEFYFQSDMILSKWQVNVHPNYNEGNQFGVFLNLLSSHEVNVKYSFKIVDTKNQVIDSCEFTRNFTRNGESYVATFNRSEMVKLIMSSDNVFRVICEMVETKPVIHSVFYPLELDMCCQLKAIISNDDFYDVKIQVGTEKKTLLAHKLVLAAASPVLCEEMKKIKQFSTPLQIDGFAWETINAMLEFIYKNELNLDENNATEILLAANKFNIISLQMRCEQFMCTNLSIENSLDTLTAIDYINHKLLSKIFDFIRKNIRKIIELEERWQKFTNEQPEKFKLLFDNIFIELSKKLAGKSKPTIAPKLKEVNPADIISSDYAKLYQTMKHSDLVFEVDGQLLKAHKGILSCRSPVFDAMFNQDTSESTANRIKIEDFDYATMVDFLKFIYCGEVDNLIDNSLKLYWIADKFDVQKLKEICRAWMEENVTISNVLEVLELADLHSFLEDIKKIAFYCIMENFSEKIPNWDDFSVNNPGILRDLLKMILELDDKMAVQVIIEASIIKAAEPVGAFYSFYKSILG